MTSYHTRLNRMSRSSILQIPVCIQARRRDQWHQSCILVYRRLQQPYLPTHPPTINSKNLATNIPTRPTRQKHNTTLEVIRVPPAPSRDSRQDALRPLLVVYQRRVHLSRDIAGCDSVDADTLGSPLVAESLCELRNTAFAGRIRRHRQATLEAEQRRDVDDRASTAVRVCVAGEHVCADFTAEREDRTQIDLQDIVPVVVRELV
jgi:hypothetical protein